MKKNDSTAGCFAVIALGLLIAWGLAGTLGGCNPDYSDGQRSGELRKFSRKGVFVKSWEGELLLSQGYVRRSDGSGHPDIWKFSVQDEAVAKRIQALPPSTKVTVEYRQWLIRPVFRQDSDYTAVGVK